MLTVENFTTLAQGSISFEGFICTCPRCGRSGIERPTESGGRVCLHIQATEIVGDGMVTETVESCSLSEGLPFDLRGEGVI